MTSQLCHRPAEVAPLIGRSVNSVYKLIQRGMLPAKRLGRRVLIPHDELEAFIARLPPAAGHIDAPLRGLN